MQVEFIKHLYTHLNTRYAANVDAPQLRAMFPKPSFKIVVLYVNEAVSIARQMARQTKSAIHNQKVREALAGNMMYAPTPPPSGGAACFTYIMGVNHHLCETSPMCNINFIMATPRDASPLASLTL